MTRYMARCSVALTLLAVLTACVATGTSGGGQTGLPSGARVASRTEANATLYALNSGSGTISIYADGGARLLRSIDLGGRDVRPFALDQRGHLFAPLESHRPYVLNVYANNGAKLVQKLTQQGDSFDVIVVDSSGNLYVTCAARRVCEYPKAGKTAVKDRIVRKIQLKHPGGGITLMAADHSGDIAVSIGGQISVFPPHVSNPSWTVNAGLVSSMAFDTNGNLYVGTGVSQAEVLVYAPGSSVPTRTIIDNNGTSANDVALDQSNNLYVLTGNCGRSCTVQPAVTVYPAGSDNPSLEITDGIMIGGAHDMAVSPSGEVFVTNEDSPGSIPVYPSGQTSPAITVYKGLNVPIEVGVSAR